MREKKADKNNNLMNLTKYKEFVSDIKSTKKILVEEKNNCILEISELESDITILKEAREIVSATGILAQDNTKKIFESLITQALQAVFGEEYSFELESRFFRNQPETEMFVVENGIRYSPKDEKGGAIIDMISFAARIVSWAIMDPRPRNTIFLDEPFRCLAKETLPFLAQLMQDISDELHLQFLYITHEKQLAEVSCRSEKDTCHLIKKIDGISIVERIV